jgi:hypothetical protein
MVKYKINKIGNNTILVREEERIPKIKGLPPTSSSCIIMESEEIPQLIEFLQSCQQNQKLQNLVK